MKKSKQLLKLLACVLVLVLLVACAAPAADDPPPQGDQPADTPATGDPPAADPSAVTPPDGSDPVEITVSWWGGAARHERTLEMIDLYTTANPHVSVLHFYAGFGDYFTQMATWAAANDLPDAMLVQLLHLGNYADMGFIRPIQPYVDAGLIDLSNFTAGALAGSSIGGQLFGATFGDTASVIAFNAGILQAAGAPFPTDLMSISDYNELLISIVPMLPDGIFVSEFIIGEQFMELFMRQHGVYGLVTEDNSAVAFTPDMLAAFFQWYIDLYAAGVFGPREFIFDYQGLGWGDTPMAHGQIAIWGTNANQGKIVQAQLDDEIRMVRPPVVDNAAVRHAEVIVCSTWTISTGSSLPEEAARFISFMINDWEAQRIYNMDIGVPGSTVIQEQLIANLDLNDPIDILIAREIEILVDIGNTAAPFDARPPGFPLAHSEIERLLFAVVFDNMPIDAAVDEFFSFMSVMLG